MNKIYWLAALLMVAGLQGCLIQNPDTDQGLATMKDRVTTLVYLKAVASVRIRLFRQNGTTRIFVANQTLSRLSAIELFLQVVNGPPPDGNLVNYTSGIPNFSKTPIVETGLVIPDLEPGEERDLGQLVGIFPTQMNKLSLMVTPMRYKNASTTFGHPLSGSFTGSYAKRDFGYGRSAGSLRGIIDSDGGFFFWLADSSETTRISFLYGIEYTRSPHKFRRGQSGLESCARHRGESGQFAGGPQAGLAKDFCTAVTSLTDGNFLPCHRYRHGHFSSISGYPHRWFYGSD